MAKSNYDVASLIKAEFNSYGDSELTFTCGNVTKKFKNPDVYKGGYIISLFQYLRQHPNVWDIVFKDISDEQACELLLKWADSVMIDEDTNEHDSICIKLDRDLVVTSTNKTFQVLDKLVNGSKEVWAALVVEQLKDFMPKS